jgi:hypothetical protein
MSLKPSPIQPVPEETARVARAAFRKGNPLLKLRDEFGAIFADADFADLFPRFGQPGLPPWRLALVTLLQFRENLPDRQAAEAVRVNGLRSFPSLGRVIFPARRVPGISRRRDGRLRSSAAGRAAAGAA